MRRTRTQVYGASCALPYSSVKSWFDLNPLIIRGVLSETGEVVGYLTSLPVYKETYLRSLLPSFDERTINAHDISTTWSAYHFVSSIVVLPSLQGCSPVSKLLRASLLKRLIEGCDSGDEEVYLSAQALSEKGAFCMTSLGMSKIGDTDNGWKIYRAVVRKQGLPALYARLTNTLVSI